MDMNWYYSAEYYMNQQEWPSRLKPTLRDDGFDFEVENPPSSGGVLIIPSDWEPQPAHNQHITNSMVFRTKSVTQTPSIIFQNATVQVEIPIQTQLTTPHQVPTSFVLLYNPASDSKLTSKIVNQESNIRSFASVMQGALPHGAMLFKHVPKNRLYLYMADEIWQWQGDVDAALQVITHHINQHVAQGIFLCWNSDLRRYLVVTVRPKKYILDWKADFDKPNISRLFTEAMDRILAYNSSTGLVLTMNKSTAKLLVQSDASAT